MLSFAKALFKAGVSAITPWQPKAETAAGVTASDTTELDETHHHYYLGYREGDRSTPWAKYYDPHLAPLTVEFQDAITVSADPSKPEHLN